MPAQDALDEHAELRAHVLSQRPVDRNMVSYRRNQLAGDRPQGLVAQYLDRAVVGLQRVVKG